MKKSLIEITIDLVADGTLTAEAGAKIIRAEILKDATSKIEKKVENTLAIVD
jgi:hypothetical protein